MFDIHVISCRALRVDLTCRCRLALCARFDGRHPMPHLRSAWRKTQTETGRFSRGYIFKKKKRKKKCVYF